METGEIYKMYYWYEYVMGYKQQFVCLVWVI